MSELHQVWPDPLAARLVPTCEGHMGFESCPDVQGSRGCPCYQCLCSRSAESNLRNSLTWVGRAFNWVVK